MSIGQHVRRHQAEQRAHAHANMLASHARFAYFCGQQRYRIRRRFEYQENIRRGLTAHGQRRRSVSPDEPPSLWSPRDLTLSLRGNCRGSF